MSLTIYYNDSLLWEKLIKTESCKLTLIIALVVILNMVARSLMTFSLLPASLGLSMDSTSVRARWRPVPCLAIRSLQVFMSSSLAVKVFTMLCNSFLSGSGSTSSSLSAKKKYQNFTSFSVMDNGKCIIFGLCILFSIFGWIHLSLNKSHF